MKEKISVSTPGRICLFGEHQDYLGLPVIAGAISKRIKITAVRRSDDLITLNLPDINEKESFSLSKNLSYIKERDYFRSAVNVVQRYGFILNSGLDCEVRGNIPINSGTSSSSALVVSWINLLIHMSEKNGMVLPEEIAKYAHEAEVVEFGEPGGVMDHYSTACGKVVYIETYPKLRVDNINTDMKTFVLGDSCEPKDTKGILKRVKDQMIDVIKHLQKHHSDFLLQNLDADTVDSYSNDLNTDQLDLLKATIANRDKTGYARNILEKSRLDHKKIGELLYEHHEILRDKLKISTPKIDRMIDAALKAGAYGAKINGSGGGGCMFAYTPENSDEIAEAINRAGGKSYIVKIEKGTGIDTVE